MNSAELLDSREAIMPLSATRDEVNNIANYIQCYRCDNAINIISEIIHAERIRHVLLVGSGDSYAMALLYAALFNQISALPVRAIQSWEFICENHGYLDNSWLVIVLSASGRQSPVVESLMKAQATTAQVVGITNQAESPFALRARNLITTGATKVGMPTQCNVATALWLEAIGCLLSENYRDRFNDELARLQSVMRCLPDIASFSWCQELIQQLSSHRVTLLGSGGDYGLAVLFSNLLWCGPQQPNQVLQLEEYAHALRLNQASTNDLVIIMDCTDNSTALINHITDRLSERNIAVKHINHNFLSLIMRGNEDFLQQNENCRYYAMIFIFSFIISATEHYLDSGGRRVSLE